jgi:hypothetical protein
MDDQIRISYSLVGTGWSECIVETKDARSRLSASYLSDALGNLVLSAISVASGFHRVEFGFDEEPGEYRWCVESVDNNTTRLRIFEFEELWGNKPSESGRLMLEVMATPLSYAKAVQTCAEAVLQEHGLTGYAEKWAEHEFPAQALELLGIVIARWEQ